MATEAVHENCICKEHTGIVANISHLHENNDAQWKLIREIQKMQNRIFGGIIILLIGAFANLILQYYATR